ncbi:hypothetical protein [Burkholderia sp. MBR-1]|uniref:hypothetical protein n=1 Tax=Burkholderia sp. MBR-1 TaxID=2732364 RepID=UPI0015EFBAC3|nr:hypothetical protein [Burkholderia sp. MBR-1]QMI49915.1 hypothetical protein MBR110_31135 [Burkholderia sp. MBR-1]
MGRKPNPRKVCRYHGIGFEQILIGERKAEIAGRTFIARRESDSWRLIEEGNESAGFGCFHTLSAVAEKILDLI